MYGLGSNVDGSRMNHSKRSNQNSYQIVYVDRSIRSIGTIIFVETIKINFHGSITASESYRANSSWLVQGHQQNIHTPVLRGRVSSPQALRNNVF